MRNLPPLCLTLALLLTGCGSDAPSAPEKLELLVFEIEEDIFSEDYTVITLYHPEISVERFVEIYRGDRGTYQPADRAGLLIQPGKLAIRDPERTWRDGKIQCPYLQIVIAVYPSD